MKNLIPILFLLILAGCATVDIYTTSKSSVDLSEYSKQGIFITTGDTPKDYTPVSILTVTCFNGHTVKYVKDVNVYYGDSISRSVYTNDLKSYKPCTVEDLIPQMIEDAKAKGANGIIKFEIQHISKSSSDGKYLIGGLQITGMAIKFK